MSYVVGCPVCCHPNLVTLSTGCQKTCEACKQMFFTSDAIVYADVMWRKRGGEGSAVQWGFDVKNMTRDPKNK